MLTYTDVATCIRPLCAMQCKKIFSEIQAKIMCKIQKRKGIYGYAIGRGGRGPVPYPLDPPLVTKHM